MSPRPRHAYMTVSDLNAEREAVPWYWRVTALLATWMIFGGYVIMTPLFHDNPRGMIAIDPKILTIFVIALFIVGYCLTGIVCLAVKCWMFQTESVFLPTISSSALGLLTALYNFLVYQNTQWNAATIIAIVLSAGMTALYAIFFILTTRRISKLRSKIEDRNSPSTANIFQPEVTPYDAWITNMFPSVRRLPPDYVPPSEQEPYRPHYRTEEEIVNENFAKLLARQQEQQSSRVSPSASTSTFRIDLPPNDESDNENGSPNARRTATLRAMVPARLQGQQQQQPPPPPPHGLHEYYAVGASSVPAQSKSWTRGRSDARAAAGEHARAKSREERRTEIELGHVAR